MAKKRTRRDANEDTNSEEEIEMEVEPPQRSKKENDLRKLNKKQLIDMCLKLGFPREDVPKTPRWDLVSYISKNAISSNQEYYRDKKRNQQELNAGFQNQVNMLFYEQIERLQHAPVPKQTQLVYANIFSEPSVPVYEIEPLKSPDEVQLIANNVVLQPLNDIVVPGIGALPVVTEPQRGGLGGGFGVGVVPLVPGVRSGPYVGPNGRWVCEVGVRRRPLMVRRLKLHVSKTGDITGSVEYRRSGKDVRNVLEVEKKFARPDVSLEQSGCGGVA